MAKKEEDIKRNLMQELSTYFGTDTKRIEHAKKVMYFAEELLKQENADWLVNLKDELDIKDKNKLKEVINRIFLTEAGKTLAQKLYLA